MVHDDGVVAPPVVGPGLGRERLVRPARGVRLLDVGLLLHAVQVLVQAVQQERQQLLCSRQQLRIVIDFHTHHSLPGISWKPFSVSSMVMSKQQDQHAC